LRLDWEDHSVRWTIDRLRADTADRLRSIKGIVGGRLVAAAAFDGPQPGFARFDRYRKAEPVLTRRPSSQIGKPGPSNSPVGKMLNDAANARFDAVRSVWRIGAAIHAICIDGDSIVEAFPNAFLDVMIEDPNCLSALRGNRSDVYFEYLAGRFERILDLGLPGRKVASRIAKVTNHDDRAALVCTLTAPCVVASDIKAVGDNDDGWITLKPRTFLQNRAWRLLEANAGEVKTDILYSTAAC
jgi:hypothetical protein